MTSQDPDEQVSPVWRYIGKYWTNKRCIPFVGEAMECLGGAGYVEESILPRLYREAPLNGIWEGSGNVICLDVLRTMQKEPQSMKLLMARLSESLGKDSRYDSVFEDVARTMKQFTTPEDQCGWLVGWWNIWSTVARTSAA